MMTALRPQYARAPVFSLLACIVAGPTARAGAVNLVSQTRYVDVNTQDVPG